MGWLSMTRSGMAPFATPKAYLDNQCTYALTPDKGREKGLRVLKSTVRSNAYYAACQSYTADGPEQTFAIICLIKWNPAARDCPASILDLLGPPGNDYAAQWREKCRQRLALTTRRKPATGDTLVLTEALTFTDGKAERSFRVVQAGKKTSLRRAGDGVGVRISSLMTRAWTIVPAPIAPAAT